MHWQDKRSKIDCVSVANSGAELLLIVCYAVKMIGEHVADHIESDLAAFLP